MASDPISSTNIASAKTPLPVFPRIPTHRLNTHAIYNMSSPSSTPTLHDPMPTAAMSSLSLLEDDHTTPTPKDRKALSESSISTMTPPNSSRGAPLAVETSTKGDDKSSDKIFVKLQDDDDVFGRNSSRTSSLGAKRPSNTTETVTKVQAHLATPISFKQIPRPDRMNSPITPANAQGVLPPEACVFVANLATSRGDDELEISCHEHFSVFGECHVKVRRDRHRHPFALVQYYNIDDANKAIQSSHDIVIDGRSIRCEPAQARRSLVLVKVGGGVVTMEEAKEVLGSFGPISHMHPTTNSDARDLGLPEGMWVQFAYYLDFKDAVRSFNTTTSEYRIHLPPEIEARTRTGPGGSPVVQGFRTPRSVSDQKSIFVGNLPAETTEQTLKQLFSSSGVIRAVNVIHKPIHGGNGYNVFGFVEFSTVGEAETAANTEVEICGAKIRVEPKEYSARRHTRLQQYPPAVSPFYRSPRETDQVYNSHGVPIGYSPGFYAVHSPAHPSRGFNTVPVPNEMSPFHHQAGYNNVYGTPPPRGRMLRAGEILYTGSPHHMPHHWSPFVTASGYGGGMVQIPEELDGQHY